MSLIFLRTEKESMWIPQSQKVAISLDEVAKRLHKSYGLQLPGNKQRFSREFCTQDLDNGQKLRMFVLGFTRSTSDFENGPLPMYFGNEFKSISYEPQNASQDPNLASQPSDHREGTDYHIHGRISSILKVCTGMSKTVYSG